VRELTWDTGSLLSEGFSWNPVGIILVRRGGYAVGLAEAGRLVASKVGRRHVQGRTAAGGWSQQRFARRRANQADELVEAVAGHASRILVGEAPGIPGRAGIPAALILGGDRAMCAAVLAERELAPLAELPRRELPDLPDPNAKVLARALWRGRAVWVTGSTAGLTDADCS
jgi:hypothetical protein